MSHAKFTVHPTIETIALEAILPSRTAEAQALSSRKYASIRASILEMRIIEPLLVYPIAGTKPRPGHPRDPWRGWHFGRRRTTRF